MAKKSTSQTENYQNISSTQVKECMMFWQSKKIILGKSGGTVPV